ncbi:MAG: serine hydrolase family protein [Rhodocyclaceae bacterium]|nr:serine hydrolase family protein [Rhodocyclaceae bacterium]
MSMIEIHRNVPTLIVPGLHGSGCAHWQSWWQAVVPDAQRVEQDEWSVPDLDAWTDRLLGEVDRQARPVWLVAHSFGCLTAVNAISQLANRKKHNIAGAFLVAAADPERFGLDQRLPLQPLPVPTALVVSSNDPWLSENKALWMAERWGAEIFPIGHAGHVNTAAGFGPWIEGLVFFRDFVRRTTGREVRAHRDEPRAGVVSIAGRPSRGDHQARAG